MLKEEKKILAQTCTELSKVCKTIAKHNDNKKHKEDFLKLAKQFRAFAKIYKNRREKK